DDEERHHQFDEVVEKDAELLEEMRQKVKVWAERDTTLLRFVVIVKERDNPPTFVSADLDESGAEHDPKDEPSEKPDDLTWRIALGKRAWIPEGAQEDG